MTDNIIPLETTYEPIRTKAGLSLEAFKYERERRFRNTIIEDRLFDENANRPNENSSPLDVAEYLQKANAKKRANASLAVANYQANNDPNKALTKENVARTLGLNPLGISDEDLDVYKAKAIEQDFTNLIADRGYLPDNIMTDINFMRFVGKDTYNYLVGLRDLYEQANGEDGILDTISRAYKASIADFEVNEDFYNQDITFNELNAKKFANNYLYKRDDDGLFVDVARVVSDQFAPIADNPWLIAPVVLAIGLGARAGKPQMGLMLGSLFTSKARYEQNSSQLIQKAMAENPDLDFEQVKDDVALSAIGMTALDLMSDFLMQSVMLGSKNVFKGIFKGASKANIPIEPMTFAQKFTKTSKGVFANFGTSWTGEVITEGIQGGIGQMGVNKALDKDTWENVAEEGWKNAVEAMSVMGVIAGVGATMRGGYDFYSLSKQQTLQQEAKQAFESTMMGKHLVEGATIVDSIKLNQEDPTVLNDLISKISSKKVYTTYKDLQDYVSANNIDLDKYDKFKDLEQKAETNPDDIIEFNDVDVFTILNSNKTEDLIRKIRPYADGKSIEEAGQFVQSVDIKELGEQIKRRYEFETKKGNIRKNLYSEILKNAPNVNANNANKISHLYTNFYANLSNILGIDIETLYNDHALKLKHEVVIRDLGSETEGTAGTIHSDNVSAQFNSKTKEVLIKETTNAQSIIHELAHGFMHVLLEVNTNLNKNKKLMAPENVARFQSLFKELEQGLGMKNLELKNISKERMTKAQELFVNKFFEAMLDPNVVLPFKRDFKRWIATSYQNFYMQTEMAKAQGDPDAIKNIKELSDQEAVRYGLKEAYGFESDGVNDQFRNVINAITSVEEAVPDYGESFNRGIFTSLIDNPNLDPTLVKEFLNIQASYDALAVDGTKEQQNIEKKLTTLDPAILKSRDDLKKKQETELKKVRARDGIADVTLLTRYDQLYKELDTDFRARLQSAELHAFKELGIVMDARDLLAKGMSKTNIRHLKSQGLVADYGFDVNDVRFEVYHDRATNKRVMEDFLLSSFNEEQLKAYINSRAISLLKSDARKYLLANAPVETYMLEKRAKIATKEFNLLLRMTKQSKVSAFHLNMLAVKDVLNTKLSDLDSTALLRQASKYRDMSTKAITKGDIIGASRLLQQELFCIHKAQKVVDIEKKFRGEAKRLQNYFDRYSKKGKGNNDKKQYSMVHTTIGHEAFVRLGLSRNTLKHKQRMEFLQKNDPDTFNSVAELLTDDITFYRNMTLGDLNNTMNKLTALQAQASYNQKIKELGDTTVAEQAEEMLASLDVSRNKEGNLEQLPEALVKSLVPKFFEGVLMNIGKVSSVCKYIDGKEYGPFWKYIYQPLRVACTSYINDLNLYKKSVSDIMSNYGKALTEKFKTKPREKTIATAKWLGYDLGNHPEHKGNPYVELMGIVAHVGNNYNRQCLIDTIRLRNSKFDEAMLDDFLDTMQKQGYIDRPLMDTVQALWDLNEGTFEKAQKTFYHLNGYPAVKQEHNSFKTAWGETYRGGYMPLLREEDAIAGAEYQILDIEEERDKVGAMVSHGFMNERKKWNTAYSISTDITKLITSTDRVIRYANVQPSIKHIQKLLNHEDVRVFLEKKHPEIRKKIFEPWLKAISNNTKTKQPENMRGFYEALMKFKKLSSAMIMFGNFNNAIQGTSQLGPLMATTDKAMLMQSAFNLVANHSDMKARALEHSAFMKTRLEDFTVNVDLLIGRDVILPSTDPFSLDSVSARKKQIAELSVNHSYFAQQALQRQLDLIAWDAKYSEVMNKRQAEFERNSGNKIWVEGTAEYDRAHAEAVALADDNVRETSSSFDLVDTSALERDHPWVQVLTQFSNYFWTIANLFISRSAMASKNTKDANLVKKFQAQLGVFFFTIWLPAMIADAINKVFTQAWKEEEDEDAVFDNKLDTVFGSPFRTVSAMIPFVGAFMTTWYNEAFLDENFYTSSNFNVATITIPQQGFRLATDIMAEGTDMEWTHRQWRDLGYAFALVSGVPPASFAFKWIGTMIDWLQGDINPDDPFDKFMTLTQAKPSKEATE